MDTIMVPVTNVCQIINLKSNWYKILEAPSFNKIGSCSFIEKRVPIFRNGILINLYWVVMKRLTFMLSKVEFSILLTVLWTWMLYILYIPLFTISFKQYNANYSWSWKWIASDSGFHRRCCVLWQVQVISFINALSLHDMLLHIFLVPFRIRASVP